MITLFEPTPRVCPNQPMPKYPPMGNFFIKEIINWFNVQRLNKLTDIKAATIDGYIVNNESTITRLMFKREYQIQQHNNIISIEDLLNNNSGLFLNIEEVLKIKDDYKILANYLGCGIDLLFLPKDYPLSALDAENQRMILYTIENPPLNIAKFSYISANDYAQRIYGFRGFDFRYSKPLITANSYLECYFANSLICNGRKNPYPGDLDLFLYDFNGIKIIVEFKTHNLNTAINNESYDKYIQQDGRRLQVLFNLGGKLNSDVLFVFWGKTHDNIKLQLLSNKREMKQELVINKDSELLAKTMLDLCRL